MEVWFDPSYMVPVPFRHQLSPFMMQQLDPYKYRADVTQIRKKLSREEASGKDATKAIRFDLRYAPTDW